MFPAIYGKYKPQPHIRVHVKAEIGDIFSANRASHERQFVLTQKIKLKKNRRYLIKTIPPDAILSFFSFCFGVTRTYSVFKRLAKCK